MPQKTTYGEEQLAVNCSDVLSPLAAVPTSIQSDLGGNISPFPSWHWLQTLLRTLSCESAGPCCSAAGAGCPALSRRHDTGTYQARLARSF